MMARIHNVAAALVSNVAFNSPTLVSVGGVPYNWYWYGRVVPGAGQFEVVDPKRPMQSPANPYVPPRGAPSIGWLVAAGEGVAFVGTVAGGAQSLSVTDCSGFVSWVINAVSPRAFADYVDYARALAAALPDTLGKLDELHGQPWPSAADFAFAGSVDRPPLPPAWTLVATEKTIGGSPEIVQPGDILAYGLEGGTDTGHVMIVDRLIASPEGFAAWAFRVFDASDIAHLNDSREGKTGTGAGTVALRNAGGEWQFTLNFRHWFPVDHVAVLRLASS